MYLIEYKALFTECPGWLVGFFFFWFRCFWMRWWCSMESTRIYLQQTTNKKIQKQKYDSEKQAHKQGNRLNDVPNKIRFFFHCTIINYYYRWCFWCMNVSTLLIVNNCRLHRYSENWHSDEWTCVYSFFSYFFDGESFFFYQFKII